MNSCRLDEPFTPINFSLSSIFFLSRFLFLFSSHLHHFRLFFFSVVVHLLSTLRQFCTCEFYHFFIIFFSLISFIILSSFFFFFIILSLYLFLIIFFYLFYLYYAFLSCTVSIFIRFINPMITFPIIPVHLSFLIAPSFSNF